MNTSLSTSLSSLALLAGASLALGGLPCPSLPTDYFDCLESKGVGKISGKAQTLLMHRDFDGGFDGTSGTLALTLNYLSPDLNGFSLGAQYINSTRLFETGDANAGYRLHNDDFNVLNEAYLAYNFGALGCDWATVKVGRQIVNYDFAPTYNIRQKDQAFEAVILKLEPAKGLRIDVGHLERFSSWSSRDASVDATWQADFIDISDAARVPYGTNGMQFISATYDGLEPWSFTVYDFYGEDLYNTFGAKASYKWDLGPDRGSLTLRGHWANQQDVGRMDTTPIGPIDSNIIELGVDWACHGLTLSAGTVIVDGDRYQTPFRTSFTIDTELLWYTDQFLGETTSGYLKGVYKTGDWLFYAMGVIDEHDDSDTTCWEIDTVVKYSINDCMYTSIKAGYGARDYTQQSDSDALDLRWFLGWTF